MTDAPRVEMRDRTVTGTERDGVRVFRGIPYATADRFAPPVATPAWGSPAMGGWLGACHGLEIAFAFGNQGRGDLAAFTGSGPEADALAATMMDAWVAFAHTGDPSTAALPWHRYGPENRLTMVLGRASRVESAPRDEERSAVDAALAR